MTGRIASGEEQGRFVLIQDNVGEAGGFLILTAEDSEFTIEGADCWVESRKELERFVEESGWVIEWQDG